MKPETPAEGILKTSDFGNSKWYKVVCGCGQSDHEINFEVEADECGINVNTFVTSKTDYWSQSIEKRYDIDNPYLQELDWTVKDIINGFVTRLKLTWTVWAKGYVKSETTIIMTEQQALNYSEVLKSAVNDVKKFRSKQIQSKDISQTLKEAEQGDCV